MSCTTYHKWREAAPGYVVQCDLCKAVGKLTANRTVRLLHCAVDGCTAPAKQVKPRRCGQHLKIGDHE